MLFDAILNLAVTEKFKSIDFVFQVKICIQWLVFELIQQPDIASNLACFSHRFFTSSYERILGVYFALNRIKSAGYESKQGFIVKSNLC